MVGGVKWRWEFQGKPLDHLLTSSAIHTRFFSQHVFSMRSMYMQTRMLSVFGSMRLSRRRRNTISRSEREHNPNPDVQWPASTNIKANRTHQATTRERLLDVFRRGTDARHVMEINCDKPQRMPSTKSIYIHRYKCLSISRINPTNRGTVREERAFIYLFELITQRVAV